MLIKNERNFLHWGMWDTNVRWLRTYPIVLLGLRASRYTYILTNTALDFARSSCQLPKSQDTNFVSPVKPHLPSCWAFFWTFNSFQPPAQRCIRSPRTLQRLWEYCWNKGGIEGRRAWIQNIHVGTPRHWPLDYSRPLNNYWTKNQELVTTDCVV